MSILDEIYAHKRLELEAQLAARPLADLEAALVGAPPVPDFTVALRDSGRPSPRLIAEVKQRSPSKGLLARHFDPRKLAAAYAANGAAAVSVLTDEKYFGGLLDHLAEIARYFSNQQHRIPLLRKDFIFDRYQLLEARLAGASAALLIVAMLEADQLDGLVRDCGSLGMSALVEVHDRNEMSIALDAGAQVIGINNRNLHTFEVDLATTINLLEAVPPGVTLVSESGIRTPQDARLLGEAGVDAILVGEGIVRAPDPGRMVRALAAAGEPAVGG